VICPNCSAGEISPLTHRCELCGFVPEGTVAVAAPRTEAIDDLARQELAEQFRFDAFLGRGASTAVYLARTPGSDRQIVVKVLPRALGGWPDADERFRRAVEAVAAIEHPHIVPVFDHGRTEHLYWYSMEHVRGRSLHDFLLQRGPLDLKACLRVAAQVGSALDYAHRRGIVHGSLKPGNVLIDAEGWVHVCDLLVSRALDPAVPPAPPGNRSPSDAAESAPERSPYVAPEGLCTPASDQYALAALVTECLTGAKVHEASGAAASPSFRVILSGFPANVVRAVERARSPRPMDRFPGVLDFAAALETYGGPQSSDARPSGRSSSVILRETGWEPPPRPRPWRRLMFGGALAAAAATVGLLWQRPELLPNLRNLLAPAGPQPAGLVATDSAGRASAPSGSTTVAVLAPARSRSSQSPVARPPAAALRSSSEAPRRAARPQPAPPAEPGHLFVNATPWGQLYVDGQLIGNTPKANLALPAGDHTIRVLREGYDPFERTIKVASGQTVRLTDITLVQRP